MGLQEFRNPLPVFVMLTHPQCQCLDSPIEQKAGVRIKASAQMDELMVNPSVLSISETRPCARAKSTTLRWSGSWSSGLDMVST
jgi:hypothetical protein